MNSKTGCSSIAVCQIKPVPGDVRATVEHMMSWMERASSSGAKLAIFGEMVLQDYDLETFAETSEQQNGPSAQAIAAKCKQLGISVIYGYGEKCEHLFHDSAMFIDHTGKQIGHYRKTHIWPTERVFNAGDAISVIEWNGGLKVGLGICVDVCMSDFVRSMAANGAQLIVVLGALVDGTRYERTPRLIVPARAFENRCYLAYADLAGEKYLGFSRICGPQGDVIADGNQNGSEQMLLAEIPHDVHKDVPFHYYPLRRPQLYEEYGIDDSSNL